MNKIITDFRIFRMGLWLILLLSAIGLEKAYGQFDVPRVNPIKQIRCGVSPDFIEGLATDSSGSFISSYITRTYGPVSSPGTAAFFNCGGGSKIDLYYEDVNLGTDDGFDDTTTVTSTALGGTTTLGAVRRYTFCQVIKYIESTFDFSTVDTSDHIRIDVERSFTAANPTPTSFDYYAVGAPNYNGASTGITGGYVNDYVTGRYGTGADPCPSSTYHGFVQVNFDSIYLDPNWIYVPWQNDVSAPFVDCNIDLFSTLLHEMTHCLGFYSLVFVPIVNDTADSVCGCAYSSTPIIYGAPIAEYSHLCTKFDNSIYAGTLPSPLTTKLITISGGLPIINPLAPAPNNNYWLNGAQAPDNHPLFSGSVFDTGANKSFLDHFDDQLLSYSFRERISPGDRMEYVMGPYGIQGALHRTYSKGEIQALVNTLGYTYIGTSPWMPTNHLPYSRTMGNFPLTEYDYGDFTESSLTVDTTITNNIGTSLTIDITTPHYASDFIDSDGDPITIDTATIVNLSGCGMNGNNHSLLSWTGAHPTKIVYQPRPNFYGKARIGFNIYDGKEDGSFRVVTIEVLKGTNVSPAFAPGNNMVCNGDFKEGSEIKIQGTAATENIPNTYTADEYFHEGKWQGIVFSDSHPYGFHTNRGMPAEGNYSGTVVRNSWINCDGVAETRQEGDNFLSFNGLGSTTNPTSPGDTTDRYQGFFPDAESYYNLDTEIYQCHEYKLAFDIYGSSFSPSGPLLPIAAINIGFADHIDIDSPVYNYTFSHNFPMPIGAWTHDTLAFWYCGSDSSSIMHFYYTGNYFLIDNITLTPVTTPPPLGVHITQALIPGCKTVLTAVDTNAACNVTYAWSLSTAGTVLTAQTDTVRSTTDTTYIVTVNDGCRSVRDTTTITYLSPAPITGPPGVCLGSSITLSDTAAGGTWSSPDLTVGIDTATGIVTGLASGTATITYTNNCGVNVVTPITVYPLPAAITGYMIVCIGATTTLSTTTSGCTWSSSNTAIATVSAGSGGAVSGVAAGTSVITATNTATGCATTTTVTVDDPPTAYGMVGGGTYCAGGAGVSIGLLNSHAGVSYQLLLGGIPTGSPVAGTGSVIDFGAQTAAGTYTVIATITGSTCTTMMSGSSIISIAVYPSTYTVTGGGSRCAAGAGLPVYLSGSEAGINYQLYNGSSPAGPAIAGTGSALDFGLLAAAGTYTVIATNSSGGCMSTMAGSATITVSPSPDAITGATTTICWPGSVTLSDATAGGTWRSSNTFIASVNPAGIVTGVSLGVVTISYTLSGGCAATIIVAVTSTPVTITGPSTICYPGMIALTDASPGGTWSSTATTVATIDGSGNVSGIAAGTTTISYTFSTGCSVDTVITVYPIPAAITGSSTLCAGSTITLSDDTLSGSWSSSNTAVATVSAGSGGAVSGVAAGTATITYATGGGCIATVVISVYSATAPCSPCYMLSGGGGFSLLGASGAIGADVTAGNYYIASDVTISSSLTMTDAVIFMAPYVHIYVAPSAGLTLAGCHLFSCARNMWAGIVLLSDSVQTGTLVLQASSNSTLIEDAIVPVAAESPIAPTGGAANFVASYNTVFNRNDTGIEITNYIAPSPSTASPIELENTVFTSRNLTTTPFTWPGAATLKTPISMLSPYLAPFNVATYNYEACHIALSLTMGLYLQYVGTSAYYSQVVAGVPNTADPYAFGSVNMQQNLFDTLNYGILAVNANVTSENNAFAHMSQSGEAGICAVVTNGAPYTLTVEAGVYSTITGSGLLRGGYINISPNYFYNCWNGVYAQNYSYVTGTGSYMITNQSNANCCASGSGSFFIGSGFYGYNILSGLNHNTNLSGNTIVNIQNGIAMKVPGPPAATIARYYPAIPSQITIDHNTIQAMPAGVTTMGYSYVQFPIWVDIPLTLRYTPTLYPAQINTDNNVINSSYNGIYINGANAQVSTSASNTVNTVEYPFGGNNGLPQFGIYHGDCVEDYVTQNNVTGTDYNDPTWEGIQLMFGIMHQVTCNSVSTLGVGFEFNGTGVSSTWQSNNMTNNGTGFLLGGIIGPQGDSTHLSYNQWLTTGGFTWTGTNYQTVTENGILPASSPLYLIAGAPDDPDSNSAPPIGSPTFICAHTFGCDVSTLITSGSGNGLIVLPGTDWPADIECGEPRHTPLDMLERMAQQNLPYPVNPNLNFWMGQYAVWEALQRYDTLADTSAILIAFERMAANSRFALFTQIEDTLAIGDAAEAQILLDEYSIDSLNNVQTDTTTGVQMADDTTADNIVLNYRQYYQLYINYIDTVLSGSDSTAIEVMANLCPITNGAVVFKARALYDIVYDTLRLFPNNCSDSVVYDSSTMRHSSPTLPKGEGGVTQKYTLFPNPNNGNFMLQQSATDNKPVQVEIWDALGQSICKQQVQFSTTNANLQIGNVPPGLYLLEVTDSEGRMFKFKFVVE